MLVTVSDILSAYTAMDGITVIPPLADDNALHYVKANIC